MPLSFSASSRREAVRPRPWPGARRARPTSEGRASSSVRVRAGVFETSLMMWYPNCVLTGPRISPGAIEKAACLELRHHLAAREGRQLAAARLAARVVGVLVGELREVGARDLGARGDGLGLRLGDRVRVGAAVRLDRDEDVRGVHLLGHAERVLALLVLGARPRRRWAVIFARTLRPVDEQVLDLAAGPARGSGPCACRDTPAGPRRSAARWTRAGSAGTRMYSIVALSLRAAYSRSELGVGNDDRRLDQVGVLLRAACPRAAPPRSARGRGRWSAASSRTSRGR